MLLLTIGGSKNTLVAVVVDDVDGISVWISFSFTSAGIMVHVHGVGEALVSHVWILLIHAVTVIVINMSTK